jgi:hypothetical protein
MKFLSRIKNKILNIFNVAVLYVPTNWAETSKLFITVAIRTLSFSASYFLAYLVFIHLVTKVSLLNFFYFWMAFDIFAGASESITEIVCRRLPNVINTENKLSIMYTSNLLIFIVLFLFIILIKKILT